MPFDERMDALSRMAGKDTGGMAKQLAESDTESLSSRVDALAENPGFTRELESLLAKYEGGGEAPPEMENPPVA